MNFARGRLAQRLLATPTGRLDLVIGCMYSGKTTELLRRVAAHEAAGRRCVVINSAKDVRYPGQAADDAKVGDGGGPDAEAARRRPRPGLAVSHTGISAPAIATFALTDVIGDPAGASEAQRAYAAAELVAIDEAHFFPDLFGFVIYKFFFFFFGFRLCGEDWVGEKKG
jgi:thymidine kinase